PSSSFFCTPRVLRHLPSFPTRRSSDLDAHHGRPARRRRADDLAEPPRARASGRLARGQRRQHRRPELPRVPPPVALEHHHLPDEDRKSTRLNSSHLVISYAVFCLKKKR